MSQPAKATEPSMEEILASIRRIIADDDATKQPVKPTAAKPPEPAHAAVPEQPGPQATQDDIDAVLADLDDPPAADTVEPDEDVLQLTEDMAAPEPEPAAAPQPAFRRIEATQDVIFDEPASAPAPSPPPPVARVREPEGPPLLSNAASAAVHSAFGNLAHSMLVQNSRTLEDLVKELLRPMLKTWLDDNLPVMVERLVRAEIERVSRGPAA